VKPDQPSLVWKRLVCHLGGNLITKIEKQGNQKLNVSSKGKYA